MGSLAGRKPHHFSCPFPGCDKTYGRSEHLSRHAQSHKLQKPFRCQYCEKNFSRQYVASSLAPLPALPCFSPLSTRPRAG